MMKSIRCAIYTRKSSEEGLEQDFNSLDAQREACAAYILSQASEGWSCGAERYDDGGISGGTLERPALQRLMADIEAGKIDIIVVYKVDRLTRSLLDFAKLVEAFDRKGVSFVSITQSFNTTTSMGRLTLNMLLSFAQFEREVTAERIRDKLAASKAKGMWMGGVPPLGYRPDGRSLAIVEDHAALVRDIYRLYLELGTVRELDHALRDRGIVAPIRTTASGRSYGGAPFSRGQLYYLLGNPVYTGHIVHSRRVGHAKGMTSRETKLYPGNHPPIIDQALFDRVQAQRKAQTQGIERVGRQSRVPSASLLAGLLVDEAGEPLLATHSAKCARDGSNATRQRYRYYVSKVLVQETQETATGSNAACWRIPAREIEQLVTMEMAKLFADPLQSAAQLQAQAIAPADLPRLWGKAEQVTQELQGKPSALVRALISQVQIHSSDVAIRVSSTALGALLNLTLAAEAPSELLLHCSVRLTRTGHVVRLIQDNGIAQNNSADPALVKLITRAHRWWSTLKSGTLTPTALAAREGVTVSYLLRVVRVAFLAPSVTQAILDGHARAGLEAQLLLDADTIPILWHSQEQAFLPG